jgi:hypothetical protein
MAKNLGGAVIALLEHDRVDLRAAATTVLAAVGQGDEAVERGLIGRLADADPVVRRLALEALVDHGATGIASHLVAILKRDDEALAERAAQVLATPGRRGRGRAAQGAGPRPGRRPPRDRAAPGQAHAPPRRSTRCSISSAIPSSASRCCSWSATSSTPATTSWPSWCGRRPAAGSATAASASTRSWRASRRSTPRRGAGQEAKAAKDAAPAPFDPTRDAAVAPILAEHTALLRLLGYLARPQSQGLAGRAGAGGPAAAGAVRGDRRAAPDRRRQRGQGHRGGDRGADRVRRRRRSRHRPDRDRHAQGRPHPRAPGQGVRRAGQVEEPGGAEAGDGAPAGRRRRRRGQGADRRAGRRRRHRARRRGPRPGQGARGGAAADPRAPGRHRRAGRAALRRRAARPPRPRLGGRARRAGRRGRRPTSSATARARPTPTRSCSSASSPS